MTRKRSQQAYLVSNNEIQDNTSVRQLKRLERQKKKALSEAGVYQVEVQRKQVNIKPLTEKQEDYLHALENFDQVVVTGPAGCGKTYIVSAYAAKMYLEGRISKIIIARPTESTGKSIGFLPGELEEKLAPWLAEPISVMKSIMTPAVYDIAVKNGDIIMQPLEMIRGRSFKNAFIHITECQNASIDLMKSIVTRTGEGSTLILDGDIKQTDLKEESGLKWALNTIKKTPSLHKLTGIIEFEIDDVVRSGLCKEWVKAIY